MRIRDRGFLIVASQGLTQAMTMALGMVLVRIVAKETFGTFQQVFLVYFILSGVISLQLDSSLYYFIPKLGPNRRRTLLFQTLLTTSLTAAVIGVIMFFFSEKIARTIGNPALDQLLRLFALYPFAERILSVIPAFMISMDRTLRAGVYTMLGALLRFLSVTVLCVAGANLEAVFIGFIAAAWVIAVCGIFDMLKLAPEGRFTFDGRLLRQLISYSFPLLATAVVGTVSFQLDNILVAAFFPPAVYAVYSCGAVELPVIGLITVSLNSAMMPNLVQLVQQGRKNEALYLWQEAARKSSIILFPCFVFFFLAGRDIMILMYRESYSMASIPFRVYLCALPVRIAVYATMFRALGHTRPIAAGAVLSIIINAVVGYGLLLIGGNSIVGFTGPAVGFVASYFGVAAFMLLQLSRTLETKLSKIMRWKELGTIFLLALLPGASFAIPLPEVTLHFKVLIQGMLYMSLFIGVMIASKKLNQDEKDLLMSPVRFLQTKLM